MAKKVRKVKPAAQKLVKKTLKKDKGGKKIEKNVAKKPAKKVKNAPPKVKRSVKSKPPGNGGAGRANFNLIPPGGGSGFDTLIGTWKVVCDVEGVIKTGLSESAAEDFAEQHEHDHPGHSATWTNNQ